MATRAAICIGVDHAGTMPSLKAAVRGARDFQTWAKEQNCDTVLLVDDAGAKVAMTDVFDAVKAIVDARTYEQLIIYFSGHGCLGAPGSEYWLLSRAPENANEAVNLFRSVEDSRNCGIPHVIFVSDACRSSVTGPPLSGLLGGTVFPAASSGVDPGEVDVFYATRAGDPAWELPLVEAQKLYQGIFTKFLLSAVNFPDAALVEEVRSGPAPLPVVTSRMLQGYLQKTVPLRAADLDVRIRQRPQVRVETQLPKYFAKVTPTNIQQGVGALPQAEGAAATFGTALQALRATHFDVGGAATPARDTTLAQRIGLTAEMQQLLGLHGRGRFETMTGFTFHGARPIEIAVNGWNADPAFEDVAGSGVWHVRHERRPQSPQTSSVAFSFATSNGRAGGTVLAVLPEYIGTVVVDDAGRVTSVSYVPSENSSLYGYYRTQAARLENMRAFAAVAARNGSFVVEDASASAFADRIRQDKGIDPTLGIYAAYAYAQVGAYDDVHSVFGYMRDNPMLPVPFDVVMLNTRSRTGRADLQHVKCAPFAPMLAQGWALLAPGDPMFRPIHAALRPHLVPSLWTTLEGEGATIALDYVRSGEKP